MALPQRFCVIARFKWCPVYVFLPYRWLSLHMLNGGRQCICYCWHIIEWCTRLWSLHGCSCAPWRTYYRWHDAGRWWHDVYTQYVSQHIRVCDAAAAPLGYYTESCVWCMNVVWLLPQCVLCYIFRVLSGVLCMFIYVSTCVERR